MPAGAAFPEGSTGDGGTVACSNRGQIFAGCQQETSVPFHMHLSTGCLSICVLEFPRVSCPIENNMEVAMMSQPHCRSHTPSLLPQFIHQNQVADSGALSRKEKININIAGKMSNNLFILKALHSSQAVYEIYGPTGQIDLQLGQDSSVIGIVIQFQSFVILLDLPNPMVDFYDIIFPHGDEMLTKFLQLSHPILSQGKRQNVSPRGSR